MFLNGEIFFCTVKAQNTGNPEIAIILFIMAPADQVPAECIKDKSDGLHFPYRDLFLFIRISDFQDFLRTDGLLNACQIIKILNETNRYLQFNILGKSFNRILLGRTQNGFYLWSVRKNNVAEWICRQRPKQWIPLTTMHWLLPY